MVLTTGSSQPTRSSLGGSQAGGLASFDRSSLCVLPSYGTLSNCVYTQILFVCLTYVFGPPCPWSVIYADLCLCLSLELCCDIYP